MRVSKPTTERTIANFPIQANGAEMLRIAIILAVKKGIKVCAPVHDALLIEAPDDQIEQAVWQTQQCMEEASQCVLKGFRLRSDAEIFKYPAHYSDPRGEFMWRHINQTLGELRA